MRKTETNGRRRGGHISPARGVENGDAILTELCGSNSQHGADSARECDAAGRCSHVSRGSVAGRHHDRDAWQGKGTSKEVHIQCFVLRRRAGKNSQTTSSTRVEATHMIQSNSSERVPAYWGEWGILLYRQAKSLESTKQTRSTPMRVLATHKYLCTRTVSVSTRTLTRCDRLEDGGGNGRVFGDTVEGHRDHVHTVADAPPDALHH